MPTLPFDLLLLATVAILFLFNSKPVQSFLKDFLTVGEDLWTWTTSTGEWYEDVELEDIHAGEVVIRHKFGTSRVAIDRLSAKSHQLLFRTEKWREHVSAGPAAGKIASFISSAHAEAA
jgi:hypothetical protein